MYSVNVDGRPCTVGTQVPSVVRRQPWAKFSNLSTVITCTSFLDKKIDGY
jgi:hypothetical protein